MFAKIMVIQWVGGSGPGASPNASELVFYCCHNYHKLSGLKQHKCTISQFCRSEVWMHLASFSALDLMRQNQRVRCPDLLSRGSKFIQVVGRSQFLVVAGLRSLFPFWLLAEICFQLLETPYIPWLLATSIYKSSNDEFNIFHFECPWLPLLSFMPSISATSWIKLYALTVHVSLFSRSG